jgi:Ca2+ transporting ATPase
MVTGDNQDTAMAIAKEIGIIPFDNDTDKYAAPRFRCMTGVEFRKHFGGLRKDIIDGEEKEVINDIHAFREIVKELRVLARSTPMDKYILCLGLK